MVMTYIRVVQLLARGLIFYGPRPLVLQSYFVHEKTQTEFLCLYMK